MTYLLNSATTTTTTGVWPIWVRQTYTATDTATTWDQSAQTSTTTTGSPWNIWNNTFTSTTSATTTNVVWGNWINAYADVDPRVQAEAAARRREEEARWRAQADESRRKRQAAEERAETLLRSVLSTQQNHDFTAHGYFFVNAPSGRQYRVDKARSGNLKVIDRATGVCIESLCIHQREDVPVFDTMLMQKLLIETAEEKLREVANITSKEGNASYGRGLLTGDVIPFPAREAREAA